MIRFTDRTLIWLIGFAGPVAGALISLALGMDASWDMRNYHYYNGYAVVHGLLDFNILPAQRPTFYNPLLDIPLYLLLANVPAKIAGIVLGAIHGLNFTLLFVLARRLLPREDTSNNLLMSGLVAAVGAAGGMALSLIGSGFQDNVVSLGILAALLLLTPKRNQTPLMQRRPAGYLTATILAGFAAGVAAAAKQPMVVYPVGLCLAFLITGGPWKRRFGLSFSFGIGVLLGVAVAGGPWMAYLWNAYGNPVMPFFNDIFRSPMAELKDYRDLQFLPKSFWQALFFPFAYLIDPKLTSEAPFRDIHILLAFLAVPPALVWSFWKLHGRGFAASRDWQRDYILVAAVISYVLWLVLFGIYRYALTLELLGPLLVAVALCRLPLPRKTRGWTLSVCLLAMIALTQPAAWERVPWASSYIDVQVPALPDPDHTMVLMTGYQPTSFVIPSFPRGVRFVRIMSNYTHPFETSNGFNARMEALVRAHQGPLYSLFVEWDSWHNNQGLEIYGLDWNKDRCQRLTGKTVVAPILLCPLARR